MAWIKAQNGNLFDVTSIHVQDKHSCEVRGRTQGFVGTFSLGTYKSNAIAEKVKNEIEVWLDNGAEGVLPMPPGDYLCESEKSCATCGLALCGGSTCRSCDTGYTNWKPRAVPGVKASKATAYCCDQLKGCIVNGLIEPQKDWVPGIGRSSARLVWKLSANTSRSQVIHFCPFCAAILKGV